MSLNNIIPKLTVTDESPSGTRASSRASSLTPVDIFMREPSPTKFLPKKHSYSEVSAFRFMREKVKMEKSNKNKANK